MGGQVVGCEAPGMERSTRHHLSCGSFSTSFPLEIRHICRKHELNAATLGPAAGAEPTGAAIDCCSFRFRPENTRFDPTVWPATHRVYLNQMRQRQPQQPVQFEPVAAAVNLLCEQGRLCAVAFLWFGPADFPEASFVAFAMDEPEPFFGVDRESQVICVQPRHTYREVFFCSCRD